MIFKKKLKTQSMVGMFQLHSKSVRFRVAKITPNKIGQFVAFGKKMEMVKPSLFI